MVKNRFILFYKKYICNKIVRDLLYGDWWTLISIWNKSFARNSPNFRTSPGKSLVIIHLSTSSLLARFSLKNFDENLFASSRIFSPGNEIWEALYRLYIPVTACVDCPVKQKNSSPFLKCSNTSVCIKEKQVWLWEYETNNTYFY